MNHNARLIKSVNFNNKVIWLMIVLFFAVITGIAIADSKWIYFGVVFFPFILYLCIEKSFIFTFGLYALLIPFDSILVLIGTSEGPTLTKLLGMLTILVLLFKGVFENKLKKPDVASLWWVLFVIYGILSSWWAIEPEKTLGLVQTLAGLLILYMVTISYKVHKAEFEALKWCVLGGGFFAAIFSIYNYSSLETAKRVSIELGSRSIDLNLFAFGLIIPVSICIEKTLKQNKKLMKGLLCGVLGVIIFCIIVTGSRGGLLAVGTVFIVYIISLKKRISMGIIAIVVVTILASIVPDYYFSERWEQAVETGGSGRLSIWYIGLLCMKKYWLIGAGLNNFSHAYSEFVIFGPPFSFLYRAPHNIYLGLLVELGVVGFPLVILAIWKHYQAIQLRSAPCNNHIMLKASFWAILLASFFLDTAWRKQFWLLWIMIMMNKNIIERERIV